MQCSKETNHNAACAHRLFDLLSLKLNRLAVDKDTLALVRLRSSPLPDLCRKLRHLALVDALEQNTGRLRCAGLDTLGDTQLNGVRESNLERNELLAGVGRGDGGCGVFDGGTVTDTDHRQNTDVAF